MPPVACSERACAPARAARGDTSNTRVPRESRYRGVPSRVSTHVLATTCTCSTVRASSTGAATPIALRAHWHSDSHSHSPRTLYRPAGRARRTATWSMNGSAGTVSSTSHSYCTPRQRHFLLDSLALLLSCCSSAGTSHTNVRSIPVQAAPLWDAAHPDALPAPKGNALWADAMRFTSQRASGERPGLQVR